MLNKSWRVDGREYEYLKAVLDGGFPGSSKINFTAKLEQLFAEKFESGYAISFANGTATLHAALAAAGVDARSGYSDSDLQPGIAVFDAETNADLRLAVATGRRCQHPVLWAGTGGLAQALVDREQSAMPPLPSPILGLFGSDHDVTTEQLGRSAPHAIRLPDGGPASAARIADSLSLHGVALASFDIRPGTSRVVAAARIARQIGALIKTLPAPGTLIVAGGETLRSVCMALGATHLEVRGRIVPGVPCSVIVGGRWHGVTVVSKSGAFGHPDLLRELIAAERNAP